MNSSKSQSTTKTSVLVPKADAASKPLDPCTECQKIYNNALEKQKFGAGVKICESLVELCRLNHKGKLHEQWVSKSIDLIVDQLEHSDILGELIKTILLKNIYYLFPLLNYSYF